MLKHDVAIGATGRFRALVHKGHTFNEDGTIAKEGEVVVVDGVPQETQFGRNKLTLLLLNELIDGLNNSMNSTPVAGVGNTTPTETDTLLASYAGKCSAIVSSVQTYSDTPDVNGNVWMRTVFRATFPPGSLGTGTKNITEGGIAKGNISGVNGSSQLYARGLLVDGGGLPTSVSLNTDTEYLDLFWEYTRYYKAELTGAVNLDIEGVPTPHDFVIRPCNWRKLANTSTSWWNWDSYSSNGISFAKAFRPNLPGANTTNTTTSAATGPLGTLAQYPTKTGWTTAHSASSVTVQPKTADKQRTYLLRWGTTAGNVPGGVGAVQIGGDTTTGWQVSYSPVLAKTTEKQLDLYFTVSVDNLP